MFQAGMDKRQNDLEKIIVFSLLLEYIRLLVVFINERSCIKITDNATPDFPLTQKTNDKKVDQKSSVIHN